MLALLIYALRGMGRGGFCACAVLPLLTDAQMLHCDFGSHAQRGMMLLSCLGLVLLMWAA